MATSDLDPTEQCPLCHADNGCRLAKGYLYKGPCWCEEIIVPGEVLKALAADFIEPTCFCRACLEMISEVARHGGNVRSILEKIRSNIQKEPASLDNTDFYFDPNGNLVFTANYHLKRGSCCSNGCRHCPYH